MNLYVFDGDRNLAGIVESFEYLRWTRRYSSCGAFELKAIATPENTALLQIGNYLWKNDDEEAGIIEHLELSQVDKDTITASGRFATSLLARRIIWGTETLNGSLSTCIQTLLNHHVISPTDTSRRIDFISCSNAVVSASVSTQISYKNLMDAVTELCGAADAGMKTVFSSASKTFTFTPYIGAASQAVFAHEYENLTEQTYTQNSAGYANTALVGGEGDGADRVMVTIVSGTKENRREIFVDAKDLRSQDFGSYSAALTFRGQSKLSDQAMALSYDVEINTHGNLDYKIDYDIGQTVQVLSRKWGVSMSARITEIEESYDTNGRSLNVTLGKSTPTLSQSMKSDVADLKTATAAASGGMSDDSIFLAVHPVGSIYISVDSKNPGTVYGGTWAAFGAGRTLVGFSSSDTEFNAVEKTSGEKTHVITASELASHNHTDAGHTHSITHDHAAVTSGGASADHSHGVSITSGTVSSDHSHTYSAATDNQGSHEHNIYWNDANQRFVSLSSANASGSGASGTGYQTGYTSGTVYTNALLAKSAGAHAHSVSGTTSGISANHQHAVSGNTGGRSADHTHSVDLPSFTGTSGTGTAAVGNSGGGAAHNNIQPSIVVYMWKRTA